jgi:hypothetical protein
MAKKYKDKVKIMCSVGKLFLLCVLTVQMAYGAEAQRPEVFINPHSGRDENSGATADGKDQNGPVKSFARAFSLVAPAGVVRIVAGKEPIRVPLIVTRGGLPGQPLTIEGNGAVIDLGTDITDGPWRADGVEWILERDVPAHTRVCQSSQIFVDQQPLWVPHPKIPQKPEDGALRITSEGRFAVTFPPGKSPKNSRVILTAQDQQSGVHIAGDTGHVTIRNLTVRYAGNDGFNFHGKGVGVRLENIKALCCGDQGISSHGERETIVDGAEVAFCGSRAGGVVDIDKSVTSYRNLLIHHNRRGSFYFTGKRHVLENVVSFANGGGAQLPKSGGNLEVSHSVALDAQAHLADEYAAERAGLGALLKAAQESLKKLEVLPYPGVPFSAADAP